MANVSIDNGQHMVGAEDLSDEQLAQHWEALVHMMDDNTRERVHLAVVGTDCDNRELLARYLALAPHDLVLG